MLRILSEIAEFDRDATELGILSTSLLGSDFLLSLVGVEVGIQVEFVNSHLLSRLKSFSSYEYEGSGSFFFMPAIAKRAA